jgi:DNA topoisomerase-1
MAKKATTKKAAARKAASKKSTAKKAAQSTKKAGARKTTGRKKAAGASPQDAAGKHLVIVESPTKAKTINKYLGPDYAVMPSVGHVRDLPTRDPNPKGSKNPIPGVDVANNFEPQYEVMSGKEKTVNELKRAAKQAQDVWFATDLDREGEAIAWHLAEALGVPAEQAKRVVFNAITKREIEHAFNHPRSIDHSKVDAQQARRILDRIVGYQVSPLLWKKVAGGLSAGRVQSVAVRLVVEREREIEGFTPEEYWRVTGYFATDPQKAPELHKQWRDWLDNAEEMPSVKDRNAWLSKNHCLKAELVEVDGEKFNVDDREQALKIATRLGYALRDRQEWDDDKAKGPAQHPCQFVGSIGEKNPPYWIESIQTKRTSSKPAPPFITSTMQQAAANRLGFSLQRTMRIAQQLYEGVDLKGKQGQTALITYMRTDSTHLSQDALTMGRDYIADQFGDKYLPEKPNFYSSSNQQAQEAHEAIRPTDVTLTPREVGHALSQEQYKLYDLIWRRFVACQMTPAQWDATTVWIATDTSQPEQSEASASPDARFKATGRALVFDGHLKVMGVPQGDDVILPDDLAEHQRVAPIDLDPTQHFTNPPARYTEASLQKKLEEEGIGRPSTYAPIIQTIQDRKYVEQLSPRDRRLMATDLGKVVTDMLVAAFPRIMDVPYTREMESELDQIEEDKYDWRKMLREFYEPFKERLDQAHQELQHAKAATTPASYTCPKCGAGTEYRFGKNGQFLACTRFSAPPQEVTLENHAGTYLLYKARGNARPKVVHKDTGERIGWTKLSKADKQRLQERSDAIEECDYATPIDREGQPLEAQYTDIACPDCSGRMTKRSGRFGPFLGCEHYPTCKGIVKLDPKQGTVVHPKTPPLTTDIPCPKCEAPLYLRDSKRGLWLSCSTFPKCRGRMGFNKLDEEKQNELEKQWAEHKKQNPVERIRTLDGEEVSDEYVPRVADEDDAAGDEPASPAERNGDDATDAADSDASDESYASSDAA